MADLKTSYLGLSLRNPLIVSSSGLTDAADKVKHLEEYGAGAVVLKSLFEEQIINEANAQSNQADDYPEAYDFMQGYIQGQELQKYLDNISGAKKATNIPIIASINCVGEGKWVEFGKQLESAGADAIELNVYHLPTDPTKPASHYEELYYKTVEELVGQVKIPVSVKLSRLFTNPLYVISQLRNRGVKGVVMFNRYYEPDINLAKQAIESAEVFSTQHELAPTLRWLALASAQITDIDLSASTGIHTGEDVAKAILTGADAAQLCTVLYHKGPKHLAKVLEEFEAAMKTLGVASVAEMKGKMNYAKGNILLFERSQFMKYFSSREG
ncbi:MAG: diguanylate cyclase [Bacteroidetes bacterium]|nr:MAG: diguanylate cyclase [Bacteroidota bacterium]